MTRRRALEKLHDIAVSGSGGPRQLFAVAEASFLYAERTGKRSYHLAAALYAWAYLFPEDPAEEPSPFDPRLQLAANLYNRGLTSALVSAKDGKIVLRSGLLELPFGEIEVKFDPDAARLAGPAHDGVHAHRRVRGVRPAGPLSRAGDRRTHGGRRSSQSPASSQPGDLLRAELTLPVTALLRAPRSRAGLAWPPLTATLEVHVPEVAESVDVAGRQAPLEIEPTAVLAFSLADSPIWGQEYSRFFEAKAESELYASVPHRAGPHPGRVRARHGVVVRPLGRDVQPTWPPTRGCASRYEFWFFSYDSGAPDPLVGHAAARVAPAAPSQHPRSRKGPIPACTGRWS